MAIDWDFITTLEGRSLTGDVPNAAGSASGVTVAAGVDLGQLSAAAIDAMAIPGALKATLKPYAGLQRQAAVDFLVAHPLAITADDADALEPAVRAAIVQTLAAHYDAASAVTFAVLLDAAQTVIASVAFQYGPDLAHRAPKFWGRATLQDWPGVIAELRNFGDAYPTRRKKEAQHLEDALLVA